jgi:predicted peptidase
MDYPRPIGVTLLLLLTLIFTGALSWSDPNNDYSPFTFTSTVGQTLPYRLMLPDHYDPALRYPLIVWLHGSGEVGTDNQRQLANGTEVFRNVDVRKNYPAFILVPQCPPDDHWTNMSSHYPPGTNRLSLAPTKTAQSTFELIEHLETIFSIDKKNVSAVGLSMGGFGVWDWMARRPDLFTAGLPMSGGGDVSKATQLAQMAIWAFHGNKDPVVGVAHSRTMVAAILRAGGKPRYTEINGGGHGPWSPIIAEPAVLKWLFARPQELVLENL